MKKNILLIGSGGREHSIARKLAQSPLLGKLYIAPGNPGTALVGENLPIAETQIEELIQFAKFNYIDLTIVGPEGPLVNGIADEFQKAGLNLVGPTAKAAQLEGSKKWTKALLKKYAIPTANYESFTQFEPALNYIKEKNTYPIVIKADGLAAGKGVTIAHTQEEAKTALEDCLVNHIFQQAGTSVVIEDFLVGEEASILAFSDGKTILPMLPAQDHKTIFDGDKGPNTGGMGAYCPAPIADEVVQKKVEEIILKPLLKAMSAEGAPFKGIVFAGLMIDNGDPKVVEFNARFGDPETQVVLALLETDLIEICQAIVDESLDQITLSWKPESAVCVVLASKGYPGPYEKGKCITGEENLISERINIIHAGTARNEHNELITNGGRVLGVVGTGKTIHQAIEFAYRGAYEIQFEGKYFRQDIGQKAFNQYN